MALSLDDFKKNLKDGKYETLAGARRAVGKAQSFSASDRETAKKLTDKHFGAEASAPKAAPAKKTAEKKTAAKKEAKPAKKAAAAPSKRQPKTHASEHAVAGIVGATTELISAGPVNLDDLSSISTQMHIADRAVERATMAMNSCSSIGVDKDSPEMAEHRTALSSAMKLLKSVTERANALADKEKGTTRQPKIAAPVAAAPEVTVPSNGVAAQTPAEKLFAGARPDAAADA